MRTSRGQAQGWILDRFVGEGGIEAFFRDSIPYFLEMGYKFVDLQHAAEGVRSSGMLIKGLARVGHERLAAADLAEASGYRLTARDEYHRAAKCFGRAQWAIFDDTERKRELHRKCVAAYGKAMGLNEYAAEKVVIPCEGGRLFGILHLPPADGPVPCVLFVPGLDMIKEDYPSIERNGLVQRGMAVLSIDGPGHGETRLDGGLTWRVSADGDNYAVAAVAAVDYLAGRHEIDAERIGVFGVSQGSYWAPVMAANEPRLRACACMMGSFYEQGFGLGQPTFKENVMYMTGAADEREVDEIVPHISVEGIEDRIVCPLLVLHGEFDDLTPEEDAVLFVRRATAASSTELVVYENEFHALGGVSPEAFNKAADWLATHLAAA